MHRRSSIDVARTSMEFMAHRDTPKGDLLKLYLSLQGTLRQAIPFVVDTDHLPRGTLKEPDPDDLMMPFNVIYIDFMEVFENLNVQWMPTPVNMSISALLVGPAMLDYARKENVIDDTFVGSLVIVPFFYYRSPERFMSMGEHFGVISAEGFYITRSCYNQKPVSDSDRSMMGIIIADCVNTLTLLNTENTYVDSVEPPHKLVKSRQKKGKAPPEKFNVIKVKKTAARNVSLSPPLDDNREARKSPRGHIRRGHWRRYSSGRKIFIHSMMIGNPEAVEYVI